MRMVRISLIYLSRTRVPINTSTSSSGFRCACLRPSQHAIIPRISTRCFSSSLRTAINTGNSSAGNNRANTMSSINDSLAKLDPVKVLVVGGSYSGLSAALNLLDLCSGKQARLTAIAESHNPTVDDGLVRKTPSVPIEISIVDERSGFCRSPINLTPTAGD